MRSRKELLNGARLYVVLDRQVNSYERLFEIAKEAIACGVDVIQLRDKKGSAKEILTFSERVLKLGSDQTLYMINDRVDLTTISGASGVHLGQDDIPVSVARTMLDAQAVIGVSCQTYVQAQRAVEDGADYIGFGSVFKTLTKPDRQAMDLKVLEKVVADMKIPVFAIGGIDLGNVEMLQGIGVCCFAVCRAVCEADDVLLAVKQFQALCGDQKLKNNR